MKTVQDYGTHTCANEWDFEADLHCMCCGNKGIYVEFDGDYDQGSENLCVSCGNSWNTSGASTADSDVVGQLRGTIPVPDERVRKPMTEEERRSATLLERVADRFWSESIFDQLTSSDSLGKLKDCGDKITFKRYGEK